MSAPFLTSPEMDQAQLDAEVDDWEGYYGSPEPSESGIGDAEVTQARNGPVHQRPLQPFFPLTRAPSGRKGHPPYPRLCVHEPLHLALRLPQIRLGLLDLLPLRWQLAMQEPIERSGRALRRGFGPGDTSTRHALLHRVLGQQERSGSPDDRYRDTTAKVDGLEEEGWRRHTKGRCIS